MEFPWACHVSDAFFSRLVVLIKCCVHSVRFSVFINGSSSDISLTSRGIRQGDSLSPYLYLYFVLKVYLSWFIVPKDRAFYWTMFQSFLSFSFSPFIADNNSIFCKEIFPLAKLIEKNPPRLCFHLCATRIIKMILWNLSWFTVPYW